jgi:hypothetical protein
MQQPTAGASPLHLCVVCSVCLVCVYICKCARVVYISVSVVYVCVRGMWELCLCGALCVWYRVWCGVYIPFFSVLITDKRISLAPTQNCLAIFPVILVKLLIMLNQNLPLNPVVLAVPSIPCRRISCILHLTAFYLSRQGQNHCLTSKSPFLFVPLAYPSLTVLHVTL